MFIVGALFLRSPVVGSFDFAIYETHIQHPPWKTRYEILNTPEPVLKSLYRSAFRCSIMSLAKDKSQILDEVNENQTR